MPSSPPGEPYEQAAAIDPQAIDSWTEFTTKFGDVQEANQYLAHAVYGFFGNGGTRCWVARITSVDDPGSALEQFEDIDEIAVIAAPLPPDVAANALSAAHERLVAHCQTRQDRVAVLDSTRDIANDNLVVTSDDTGIWKPHDPGRPGRHRDRRRGGQALRVRRLPGHPDDRIVVVAADDHHDGQVRSAATRFVTAPHAPGEERWPGELVRYPWRWRVAACPGLSGFGWDESTCCLPSHFRVWRRVRVTDQVRTDESRKSGVNVLMDLGTIVIVVLIVLAVLWLLGFAGRGRGRRRRL